jgi:hypothetical protein
MLPIDASPSGSRSASPSGSRSASPLPSPHETRSRSDSDSSIGVKSGSSGTGTGAGAMHERGVDASSLKGHFELRTSSATPALVSVLRTIKDL